MTTDPEMIEFRMGPGNAALVRMTSSAITLTDLGQADPDAADHVFEHPGEDFSVVSVRTLRRLPRCNRRVDAAPGPQRVGAAGLLVVRGLPSFTELLWLYGWETLDASSP